MSWHGYNNDTEDYFDPETTDIGHEDAPDPAFTFETTPSGQLKIVFDLDVVRIHSDSTGDVYVTLKT